MSLGREGCFRLLKSNCEQGRLPRSCSATALLTGGSLVHIEQMGKLRQEQAVRSQSSLPGWGLFFSLHWSSCSHH